MEVYWYLILGVIGLICLKLLYEFVVAGKKNKMLVDDDLSVFEKRQSIMTEAEKKRFRLLEDKYGDDCYIFPQINLDKLVNVNDHDHFYHYFNKLNKKSVDFVLVDKKTFATVKIIELDDYTHNRKKRRERDEFVNNLLGELEYDFERVT